LIGGTEVKDQLKRLHAINIIICTPGRLLQHLEENANFYIDQLQMLIIDEADRALDMGFKTQVNFKKAFKFYNLDGCNFGVLAKGSTDFALFCNSNTQA
jgi:hypothetical protein